MLSRYAADAALAVDGVRGLVDRALPYRRGVKLDEEGGHVTSSSAWRSSGEHRSRPVGREVQQRVREYLRHMADVDAARVDVVVDEVA